MGETLDFIVFFSAIALVPFYIAAVVFQIFCIAWAPFASSTCASLARKRGLDANRYGRIGFMYSALLFVPWLHLKRRLQDGQSSFGTSTYNYTLLYTAWLIVIVANAIVLLMTVGQEGWGAFQIFLVLFAIALGMPAWILSLKALFHKRSAEDEDLENKRADMLPERVYLMPFVWTSVNILALPVMLIIGIIIGLSLSPFF